MGCTHENNNLDGLTRMEREVTEGQLTVVLDICFDTIGLHRFFLHERFCSHYTPIPQALLETICLKRSGSASALQLLI